MSEGKFCTCPVCNREVNPMNGLTGDEQIIKGTIEHYKQMQGKQEYLQCPKCGLERMERRNALSRQFDIQICPACGTDEALRAANNDVLPASEWWIGKEIYKVRNCAQSED